MIRTAVALIAVFLAGCASQHAVTLYPRGDGPRGAGTLSRMDNGLKVAVADRQYSGTWILQGYARNQPNQCSALLLGDAGQMRCDFVFDAMWTQATGVCVDSKNVTYDMLVK